MTHCQFCPSVRYVVQCSDDDGKTVDRNDEMTLILIFCHYKLCTVIESRYSICNYCRPNNRQW